MQKRNFRILSSLALLAAALLALSGCTPVTPQPPDPPNPPGPAPGGEPIVREAPDGRLTLTIEEGEASLYFYPEHPGWDVLHEFIKDVMELEDYDPATMPPGPFVIENLPAPVIDGGITYSPKLDWFAWGDYVFPSIFLLLEDGTVHWLLAQPYPAPGPYDSPIEYEAYYQVLFLPPITALSYEPSGEGIGEPKIFGQDAAGLKYDLEYVFAMHSLWNYPWIIDRQPADFDNFEGYTNDYESHGHLSFFEGGGARLVRPLGDGYSAVGYVGSYNISLAVNDPSGQRPGILTLDLELEKPEHAHPSAPATLHCQYFVEGGDFTDIARLELWHSGGDELVPESLEPGYHLLEQLFLDPWLHPLHMTDEELCEYLLEEDADARYLVEELNMFILVTGTYSVLPEGYGRDLWLASNHDEYLGKEILYSIDGMGRVYLYDPVSDTYMHVNGEAKG